MIPALAVTLSLQSCMTILLITTSIISLAIHLFFILLFLAIFAPIPIAYYFISEKWMERKEAEKPGFRRGWREVCKNVILVLLVLIAMYLGIGIGYEIADSITHG